MSSASAVVPAAVAGLTAVEHRTFSALVQDDEDLVGHVAYSLYKRDKLKFCETERVRTAAPATHQTVDAFIRSCNLDTRISAYRAEAERLLEHMTEYVLEDAIEKVKREHQELLVRKLSESKSWWRSIAENLLGSLVVAIVWAAIVFAVAANRVGPDKAIGDFLGKDITDKPAAIPPPAAVSRPSR